MEFIAEKNFSLYDFINSSVRIVLRQTVNFLLEVFSNISFPMPSFSFWSSSFSSHPGPRYISCSPAHLCQWLSCPYVLSNYSSFICHQGFSSHTTWNFASYFFPCTLKSDANFYSKSLIKCTCLRMHWVWCLVWRIIRQMHFFPVT